MGFVRRKWQFVAVALCLAAGLIGRSASVGGRVAPASGTPLQNINAQFPATTTNIHLGLAFDYQARQSGRSVDYVFGGYFIDWKLGSDPQGRHTDSYVAFDVDGFPQNYPGHSLHDWRVRHPDWIVYRCDRKTPAYYGPGNMNVPLDFSNPAVQAYQIHEASATLAEGASGVAFDNFAFANVESRCGVYRHGVWTPLGYPGRWKENTKLREDVLNWLRIVRTELKQRFPSKTFGVNMNFLAFSPAEVRDVVPYVDMFFDEAGFTAYGRQDLSGTMWKREVDLIEYLNDQRKAVDVNGIVNAANDASVTPTQIDWVLANYLLVKQARTYTYIYAGNRRSHTGSPSGYGTFFDRPQYHVPIGHPTSGRFTSYGVEMRYYSGGLVLVNPSSWQAFSVPLGAAYRDMFGHTYTAVTLPPTSGIVLLNTY